MVPKFYARGSSQNILFDPKTTFAGNKICLLNFANFVNPGGGYIRGAKAQEEELCHHSILYPVLCAFHSVFYLPNRLTYDGYAEDRGIYSPGIVFFAGEESRTCDVMTVAAPDLGYVMYQYRKIYRNLIDLYADRIHMMFAQAQKEGVTDFILGAWGCGAFQNDPAVVAPIMADMAQRYPGIRTHFVLRDPYSANYREFREAVSESRGQADAGCCTVGRLC